MNKRIDNKKTIVNVIVSMLSTLALFWVMAYISDVVPFKPGALSTLAVRDGYYQYIEFFGWYKDVLSGKQSILYSFTNALGQNSIQFFSFYLASPFNLLIVFFDKAHLQEFFNVLAMTKIVFGAGSFALYASRRYSQSIKTLIVVLASISYAFMQYTLYQLDNIMWLDVLIMVPLVFMGIDYLINKGSFGPMSIAIGATILTNWYTGGMICLFAGIYYLYESLDREFKDDTFEIKSYMKKFLRFVIGMIVGVMISAILFFPSIYVILMGRAADTGEAGSLIYGNPLEVIRLNYPGATTNLGKASFYCGSLVTFGVIGFFTDKRNNRKQKILTAAMLVVFVMACYFKPLAMVFALFRYTANFWYRYGFGFSAILASVALRFYADINAERIKAAIKPTLYFTGIYLCLNLLSMVEEPITINIILPVIVLGLIPVLVTRYVKDEKAIGLVVATGVLLEVLIGNGIFMLNKADGRYYPPFADYQNGQIELLDNIGARDALPYRVAVTQERTMNYLVDNVNLNEAFCFGYMSMSNYNSSPQFSQIDLFEHLGYRSNKHYMTIKHQFLLPADSLVAVEYVLSPYEIEGLERLDIEARNNNSIYYNRYALPFAFAVTVDDFELNLDDNSFENWNKIYSYLYGQDIRIVNPIEYDMEFDGERNIYTFTPMSSESVIYIEIPYDEFTYGGLTLEGFGTISCAGDYSSKVYVVPNTGEEIVVTYDGYGASLENLRDARIYELDMEVLEEVTSEIQSRGASITKFDNTDVEFDIETYGTNYIYTSIPYDKGWEITVNGKRVEVEMFDDCLMMIPCEEGSNHVSLHYEAPYFKLGIVLTLLGTVTAAAEYVVSSKNKNKADKDKKSLAK